MRPRAAGAAGATGAALLLLAAACFAPAFRAGFLWDDDALTANPHMGSLEGLVAIWSGPEGIPHEQHWWPVTYTSFWLEHALFGDEPAGYHATNVLLHGLAALLLWRVLRALRVPGAFLGAALFAAHPVHVESVAWIIERKDVLSAVLALSGVLLFLRHLEGGGRRALAGSVALLVLAGLAKSSVVAVPAALAPIVWWRRPEALRRPGWAVLAVAALAVAALDLAVARGADDLADLGRPLGERVVVAALALGYYARTLVLPVDLCPVPPDVRLGGASALSVVAWGATFAAALALRGRVGRAPLAALGAWALLLAPTLGLVEYSWLRHSFVADRFQYLASAVPLAAAGAAVSRLRPPQFARGAGALLVAVLAVATFRYARVFESEATHARRIVAVNPGSWTGRFNLGKVLADEGDLEGALREYGRAIELRPGHGPAHGNRGEVLWRLGRRAEAERAFRRATELAPGLATAHSNLGVALTERGAFEEAERSLARAVALDPGRSVHRANLGLLYAKSGRLEPAVEAFRAALALDPDDAVARRSLSTALELRPDLR